MFDCRSLMYAVIAHRGRRPGRLVAGRSRRRPLHAGYHRRRPPCRPARPFAILTCATPATATLSCPRGR